MLYFDKMTQNQRLKISNQQIFLGGGFSQFVKEFWGDFKILFFMKKCTFDSCYNVRLMLRQLTNLNFKWKRLIKMMPSLLAVREISPFRF